MKRIFAAVAGLVILLAAGAASATPVVPTLTLDDGTTHVVVTDNGPLDMNPVGGIVSYTGSIGNWVLSIDNGFGQMGQNVPTMHLSSIDMMLMGSGSLMITFGQTISEPWNGPGARLSVGGVLGSTGSTATFMAMINGQPYGTMDFDTSQGLGFSGNDSFSFLPTGDDLVELCAMITSPYTCLGVTSFDYAIAPVPEPGTLVLFGLASLVVAVYTKRRFCHIAG